MLKSSLLFKKNLNYAGKYLTIKNAKFSGYRFNVNPNISEVDSVGGGVGGGAEDVRHPLFCNHLFFLQSL